MAYSHIHTQAHRHPRAYSLLETRALLHLSNEYAEAGPDRYGYGEAHCDCNVPAHGHGDTTSHGYGDLYASPASCG